MEGSRGGAAFSVLREERSQMTEKPDQTEASASVPQDPNAGLERMFLQAYLCSRGHTLESLRELPAEEAKRLMTEASIYASSKLAEVEARAHFVRDLHSASDEAAG
jgi:hypothetical protein